VVVLNRLIDIGERLRLHALAGIDHEQRAFAGGQRAVHLIGEVHMARRVDQVERVGLAILGLVDQADGLRLDGDAALALDIHRIEHLLLHFALGQPPVIWISRSASVDLPWSIWATMEKLRMRDGSVLMAGELAPGGPCAKRDRRRDLDAGAPKGPL
jgi:hypothetical protein